MVNLVVPSSTFQRVECANAVSISHLIADGREILGGLLLGTMFQLFPFANACPAVARLTPGNNKTLINIFLLTNIAIPYCWLITLVFIL